jgi:hypothetical protein
MKKTKGIRVIAMLIIMVIFGAIIIALPLITETKEKENSKKELFSLSREALTNNFLEEFLKENYSAPDSQVKSCEDICFLIESYLVADSFSKESILLRFDAILGQIDPSGLVVLEALQHTLKKYDNKNLVVLKKKISNHLSMIRDTHKKVLKTQTK